MPKAPMQSAQAARYHWVARCLHWLIALAVFALIASGLYAEDLGNSPFKLKIFFWHKSFGILILALMVLRLLWRMFNKPPAHLLESVAANKAAEYGHAMLYLLLFLMPISGWVIQSAANYPFQAFGVFSLPAIVEPSKAVSELAATIHGLSSKLLILLLVGHVGAVLVHKWATSHDVWPRMSLTKPSAVVLIAAYLFLLGYIVSDVVSVDSQAPIAKAAVVDVAGPSGFSADSKTNIAPEWVARPSQSRLGFTATYDGIEFSGEFRKFNAAILFDPENLPGSRFTVDVDVTSAYTADSTRDEALAGEEWFDYERFPLARYDARSFSLQEHGSFVARGRLTIKEYSHPLNLIFNWTVNDDDSTSLKVDASMSRLEFGVGTGMWVDPIVGHDVVVESLLVLDKKTR
jgi:cytochrome b561